MISVFPYKFNATGVYVIRHNGVVVYVGSSKRCVYNRVVVHLCNLRKGKHNSKKLQELYVKNNGDGFDFVWVEECEPERAREREAYWQKEIPTLLNTIRAGQPFSHSFETIERMKAGARRRVEKPGHRELLSERAKRQHSEGNLGRGTWSEETNANFIAKLSNALKGKKFTEERKTKLKEAWTPERKVRQAAQLQKNLGKTL